MKKNLLFLLFLCAAVDTYAQMMPPPPGHGSYRRDFRPSRGRSGGGIVVFTAIGGATCLLAPGVQFSSGIGYGFSSYGSDGDGFLIAAGVILIGISVALIIANQQNRMDEGKIVPIIKFEKTPPMVSTLLHSPGYPAAGIKISLR